MWGADSHKSRVKLMKFATTVVPPDGVYKNI